MYLIVALLGISLLVVLHEAGHMWVARRCGMQVLRFSVGFGPIIWQKQGRQTLWQLALLPIGGFVEILGMGEGEQTQPGSFGQKSIWQRMAVVLAGPATNWLLGVVLLTILAASRGIHEPSHHPVRLGTLDPQGAAYQSGLRSGDAVMAIDGQTIERWSQLVDMVQSHALQTLQFTIQRNDAPLIQLPVTPQPVDGVGKIQAAPLMQNQPVPLHQAWLRGWQQTVTLSIGQLQQIGQLLQFKSSHVKLSGLPGIVQITQKQARKGVVYLLETLAMLSIGLTWMNLLPLPALDGGRLLLLLGEGLFRRRLPQTFEIWLHGIGFSLLLVLMLWVSLRDVMGML